MEVVAENSPLEAEARAWLNAHKEAVRLSWPQIANLTDLASSTLSAFATGKYAGNNATVAAKVLAYRDRLAAQAEFAAEMPKTPQWFDTPTADRLTSLLRWAQSGKIVMIITAPGIGKTKVAKRFMANDPNVWLATMSPATAGVATMAIEVGGAIGLGEIKGSPQQLSRLIKNRVRDKGGLIIVDEAQELTDKALNELRSWHDQTGVGIVIMGNATPVGQKEASGSSLAQLSSRISYRHEQAMPMPGDVEALLDAWGIVEPDQRKYVLGLAPIVGGALRELTHTIEIACMSACGAGQPLSLKHLKSAVDQRIIKIGAM